MEADRLLAAAGAAMTGGVAAIIGVAALGCSLVTVEQQPFTPMSIQAERPEGPPPRVVLMPSSIRITEKIQFAFDSDVIESVSFSLLDEIATVLVDNPQIEKISVEGHTDKQGSAGYNRKLSKKRAKSVVTYLVEKGVEKDRLDPVGHGPDRPIADGDDEAAYELNRRVEFNIVKQGPKKVLVEEE